MKIWIGKKQGHQPKDKCNTNPPNCKSGVIYGIDLDIASIKADAIKEFAERLKKELSFGKYTSAEQIDNLVKEMVGEEQ